MSKAKPMPCPFCGQAASLLADVGSELWTVMCDGCDAEGPPTWTENEAIEKWNRRTPTQKARIRKLEPLQEEPCELSGTDYSGLAEATVEMLGDTERQEAGYPATREELVEALRDVYYAEYRGRTLREKTPLLRRIFDILNREEP